MFRCLAWGWVGNLSISQTSHRGTCSQGFTTSATVLPYNPLVHSVGKVAKRDAQEATTNTEEGIAGRAWFLGTAGRLTYKAGNLLRPLQSQVHLQVISSLAAKSQVVSRDAVNQTGIWQVTFIGDIIQAKARMPFLS